MDGTCAVKIGKGVLAVKIKLNERIVAAEAYCGVRLLATAHAAGAADLRRRRLYRLLLDMGVFRTALVLHADQTFSEERLVTE